VAAVSLYIPCYNVAATLERCLDSVLRQTVPVAEILLVDDGSRDDTLERARRYDVRILQHEQNRGLAAARNTAFRAAGSDLVAALDADCVAAPDWLERLLPFFVDPQVGAAGGRLAEAVQRSPGDRWRAAHMAQAWGPRRIIDPRFMYGNNIVLRRAAVLAAGGYDEQYRTNGEDVDMSGRLRRMGYRTVYEPSARVEHLREDSVASILRTYWRYQSSGSLAYRREPDLRALLNNAALFVRSGGRMLLRDLARRKLDLLWIDVYAPFFMLQQELRRLREGRNHLFCLCWRRSRQHKQKR
jgi:GT2 family glycosyltransferase